MLHVSRAKQVEEQWQESANEKEGQIKGLQVQMEHRVQALHHQLTVQQTKVC